MRLKLEDNEDNYSLQQDDRVIMLFDMDCFEVQVHQERWQEGKPRVVLNSSDRIVAVSYEAKQLGINRDTCPTLKAARVIDPDIIPIYIPTRNYIPGENPRPDTSIASEATQEIKQAIKRVLRSYDPEPIFEYSSGDEFYVDITDLVDDVNHYNANIIHSVDSNDLWHSTFLYNSKFKGCPSKKYLPRRLETLENKRSLTYQESQEARLIYGSTIACRIIEEILERTGYQSSVGMACNKIMSKIASGVHKPGSATIVAPSGFEKFSKQVAIKNIPGFGGKIGQAIQKRFGLTTMYHMQDYLGREDYGSFASFDVNGQCIGEEKAKALLNAAHGVCDAIVEPIECPKTTSVSWKLNGKFYTYGRIVTVLEHLWEELLDKFKFEDKYNDRVPDKIKLCIEVQNDENIKKPFEIPSYHRYIRHIRRLDVIESFFPDGFNWDGERVKSVQFVASFSDRNVWAF